MGPRDRPGNGTQVLWLVMACADAHAITLCFHPGLLPVPGDESTPRAALVAWVERLGFRADPAGFWVRQPSQAEAA